MSQSRTNDGIASQDMSTQGQYQFEEIPSFFRKCKPPPPPGKEDLWELQFCRWWGWNWVRKKEEQCKNIPCNPCTPRGKVERKKREKQKFKKCCNCLCFKKKNKQPDTLQKLYNTPSNSVILQETYTCGVIERKNDSFSRLEIQRNISRKSKRESRKEKSKTVQSWTTERNESSSSGENCCCMSQKFRSSTDESMEYINISCCPCCHSTKHSRNVNEKCHCETQTSKNVNINDTQTSGIVAKICSTQTKKKHKKRICLICCHCCQQNPCCKCNHAGSPKPAENIMLCKCREKCREASNHENPKTGGLEHVYLPGMPMDTMLYYNKHFSKFGIPSQKYPWLHTTKSDISEQIFSNQNQHQFSSPVSGKSYNITPIKVDTFEKKASSLPDPIGVADEVQYLRKLESEVKMDLESRVMLDAVCDAILFKNKNKKASSDFLNQFTYSSTESEDLINELYTPRRTYELPTFSKSLPNEPKYYDIVNDDIITQYGENKALNAVLRETLAHSKSDNVKFTDNQSNDFIERILEDKFSDIKEDIPRSFSVACNLVPECTNLKSIAEEDNDSKGNPLQISIENFEHPNNLSYPIKDPYPSLTTANPMLPCKRSSSSISKQENKKVRLEEPEDLIGLGTSHISEIFNKIDEIVLKSKVNNEVIQNVLSTIPKRSYQFCSSQNVINSINENSIEKTIEIKKETSMSINATGNRILSEKGNVQVEESTSKKMDSKPKLQNTKKKKTPSKQSLIPVKKVNEAKPNKKSNSNGGKK